MDGWKMSFLLGFPIFRGYVKLRGGGIQTLPKAPKTNRGDRTHLREIHPKVVRIPPLSNNEHPKDPLVGGWFQPIWKTWVKLEIFPKIRVKINKYLKPPPGPKLPKEPFNLQQVSCQKIFPLHDGHLVDVDVVRDGSSRPGNNFLEKKNIEVWRF